MKFGSAFMASSRDIDEWIPRWAYTGPRYAAFVARTRMGDVEVSWHDAYDTSTAHYIAEFLTSELRDLTECDLLSGANYLYIVIRRPPLATDAHVIGDRTPIAEFGFGAPPSSPEEWVVVELRALLESTIAVLRDASADE